MLRAGGGGKDEEGNEETHRENAKSCHLFTKGTQISTPLCINTSQDLAHFYEPDLCIREADEIEFLCMR